MLASINIPVHHHLFIVRTWRMCGCGCGLLFGGGLLGGLLAGRVGPHGTRLGGTREEVTRAVRDPAKTVTAAVVRHTVAVTAVLKQTASRHRPVARHRRCHLSPSPVTCHLSPATAVDVMVELKRCTVTVYTCVHVYVYK